jgi:chromosome segregation ATPase
MAGKTPTELTDLIAQLRADLNVLRAEFDLLWSLGERTTSAQYPERLARTEALLTTLNDAIAELKKRADDSERRNERLAVLESQHAELKKQVEEKDRRWWQFWVGVSAIGLTFIANLVINLLMFFARKPG